MLHTEIVKVLRDESVFSPIALQAAIQDTQLQIEAREEYLFELETKLRNAGQLRREIEIKQLKYCGLKQVFETGTMDEKKMLLSIMIHRVEISRNYEMNLKLAPGFEQFIDGTDRTAVIFYAHTNIFFRDLEGRNASGKG